MTVLVVEDEPSVAENIRNVLVQLGYRVPRTVATGEEALAVVERTPPSLVLIDLELRGAVSGAETAARLRDRFDIPVVCTTCQPAPAWRGQPDGPIVLDRLHKPFSARDLCTAIETAIQAKALRDGVLVEGAGGSLVPAALVRSRAAYDYGSESPTPAPFRAAAPRRGRVLVVDAEPALTAAVRRVLGREHDVVAEHESLAALACIAVSQPFDLVLCDLGMQDQIGLEVYEALAASHDDTAARVVFLGSGDCSPRARRVLESIANPMLPKPFSAESLRALASDYVR